jgi:hypothetical protein
MFPVLAVHRSLSAAAGRAAAAAAGAFGESRGACLHAGVKKRGQKKNAAKSSEIFIFIF